MFKEYYLVFIVNFDAHHLNSLDTFYHGNSKRREDVIPDNQKDNVSVWWVRKEKTLVKQNYMKEEEKNFYQSITLSTLIVLSF